MLVAGGESDTKENPRHSAQPKRLRGLWRGFAAVTVGARTLPGAAKGVAVLGARDRVSRGGCPAAYPRAPVIVLSLFVVACSRFVSCRVVMRCHWVSPPCFLIVYAPAMRAVAYYALSGVVVASAPHGSERGIVSRAGAACVCTSFFCEAAAAARRVVAWSDAAGTPECAAWFLSGGI